MAEIGKGKSVKKFSYLKFASIFAVMLTISSACQQEDSAPPPAAKPDVTDSKKSKVDDAEAKAKREAASEELKAKAAAKAEEAAAAKKDDEEEKDAKKIQDRIRSRQISALKDKINQKRTLMQQKQNQKTQFVSFKTQVDNASINSFNNNGTALSGLAGGLAGVGGSTGGAFGGLLASGVGAYQIISSMMDEADQRGEVLTARDAVDQQLAMLEVEITSISAELTAMETELDALIAAEAGE